MADSELFETEEGGEEVTLNIIDDGATDTEVVEKPKPQRKKKELSAEAKERLLDNLAKGRAKQAERRKKQQEAKKLKQQLKEQEEDAELEKLRLQVKSKTKVPEAKPENPIPKEVEIKREGKEGEEQRERYLKELKEKDEELNKLKSIISTAQKKASEYRKTQEQKKSAPAPEKNDKPAMERERPVRDLQKKPVYKFNYATGRMEWS